MGPVYHAIGNPFQGYNLEVKVSYEVGLTSRKYTTVSLGRVNGAWDVKPLEDIANTVQMPPLSKTPLDPFAV